MDFITIDFETATTDRDSPCEIGLTFVEKNEIKDVESWLIKPLMVPQKTGRSFFYNQRKRQCNGHESERFKSNCSSRNLKSA